jgi:hypothetical protein
MKHGTQNPYLVNMGTLIIESANQKSDSVGAAIVTLRTELHIAAQVRNQLGKSECRVVAVSGGQAFGSHPTAQTLCIGSQSGE